MSNDIPSNEMQMYKDNDCVAILNNSFNSASYTYQLY